MSESPEMMEILRRGLVFAHDLDNALSPHGVALNTAIKHGLLRHLGREGGGSTYEVTSAGRAIVERHRIAHLASIGVYEVRA